MTNAVRCLAFALLLVPAACAAPESGPQVVALGDSITYGYGLPSPSAQNYAALYAASLHGHLTNLAIPGASCGDVRNQELQAMPRGASVVILNCGTNDIGGFSLTLNDGRLVRVRLAGERDLVAARRSFDAILSRVREREPDAAIVLVNLRHLQRFHGVEDPRIAREVDEWNAMLAATRLPLADIAHDPRLQLRSSVLADLVHPSISGQQAIASDIPQPARTIAAPPPRTAPLRD